MNFMSALQMCTVPKISIVLRKSYGQAYLNMGGTRNSDEMGALVHGRRRFHGSERRRQRCPWGHATKRAGALRVAAAQIQRDSSAYDLAGIYRQPRR